MENNNLPPSLTGKFSATRKSMHDYWRSYIIEGIVLIALGVAAMIVPLFASLAVSIFLGWLFLLSGGFSFGMTVLKRHRSGFWWSLLSSAVAIATGIYLIGWPVGGVISLTFILTAFLVIDGVLLIFMAIDHRRQLSQRWGWMLINGVLDLALAGIIVLTLPVSAVWALGVIVGIDLIFGGFALVMMAIAAHKGTQFLSP